MAAGAGHGPRGSRNLELDTTSEFSHIRVKRAGSVRALLFVRDNGEEAEESLVNLKKPYELLIPYAKFMFTSYLFRPQQEKVLIVGLGGGAMVHFLEHYDPQLAVDVVEIDPAVVKIADKYFDCRSRGKVTILTADAFQHFETTESRYDVIYMDAFLKPAADTDATGVPLRMKTLKFYKTIQSRLTPEGVVVFNLNRHEATEADIATIRSAFARAYVFRAPGNNLVVVGTLKNVRETPAALLARARDADSRFKANFSFPELVKHLAP